MTERERFIETIRNSFSGVVMSYTAKALAEKAADALISEGAMFPPCKLGDKVWYISTENPHVAFEKELKAREDDAPISGILITKEGVYIKTDGIETVIDSFDEVNTDYAYLSREEAEAALKGAEGK